MSKTNPIHYHFVFTDNKDDDQFIFLKNKESSQLYFYAIDATASAITERQTMQSLVLDIVNYLFGKAATVVSVARPIRTINDYKEPVHIYIYTRLDLDCVEDGNIPDREFCIEKISYSEIWKVYQQMDTLEYRGASKVAQTLHPVHACGTFDPSDIQFDCTRVSSLGVSDGLTPYFWALTKYNPITGKRTTAECGWASSRVVAMHDAARLAELHRVGQEGFSSMEV